MEFVFLRLATKNDSPSEGYIYFHNFGTGYHEIVFPSHEEAAKFLRHEKIREKGLVSAPVIFDLWPEIDVFYVVSDGTAFIRASDARDHIAKLDDKWHTEINKDSFSLSELSSAKTSEIKNIPPIISEWGVSKLKLS